MLAEIDTGTVQSSTVKCSNGMDAFLALPGTPGPHPTMVLLHERYGLVQHTKDLAMRFATEGYSTLAPNLFFQEPDQGAIARGEARVALSDEQVCAAFPAAVERLATAPGASTGQVFVMGVCATGRYPLVLAAQRSDVAACAVFYGGAGAPRAGQTPIEEVIARSRVPVLGVFGEADHGISIDAVLRFRGALEAARRSHHLRIFPGAPHGFLNDTMPGRYRRQQAEAAWQLLGEFLARVRAGGFAEDRVHWTFESDTSTNYDFSKNVRLE